uniref:non-specific protein-tyrosine kinase n=1 Tax=Glossina austeni TaxID=7395 RepID=A0A1A9VEI8_GLOAU
MDCAQIDLYEFLTEAELQHYYNAVKNELKITNASQFKYATDEDLKSISMSRPEIRRLRKFYEKHFPHGYLSKIKRLLQAPTAIVKRDESSGSGAGGSTGTLGNASSTPGNLNSSSGAINKNNSSPSKAPNNKHIIPADAISVNKKLGTGEFGIVQQGVWTNGTERIQVAIKCLCRERMQSNPMEFLKEAAIMHSIEHENIVRLYGVVLATDSLMLVTELAHLRSLFECLKDAGLRVSFLTVPTLCEFALQICNGMRYLENKRLIHRDLAARNILVFSKNKVKISDFGLSRALGVGKDYYKTNFNVNLKLPIAWCAPECINYLRFTNASDVWAYGVCLWEMFSYGFQPWAALTGLQILEAIDAPNYQRLEQPECCPREYYNLMMKCWQDDPSKRPKFNEIYEMLPEMKPEQLKAVDNCLESKTKDHLIYRQNDIITVLDRNTGTPFWKGVLNSGKTGLFNPSNTVAYVEGLPTLNRESFSRSTSDRASSKRKLRTEMISKPQNDFKHTGHVGIDGASFGDIAFLGSSQNYNHVPRQIVTPYKPSEDIEQTPLLLPPTPTSPDSLQTASGYFADDSQHSTSTMNPSFIPSTENTPKNFTNTNRQSNTFEFPTDHTNTNTNPFSMHKAGEDNANMTMALQNNNYGVENKEQLSWRQSLTAANRQSESFDEPHQYHEISDDDEMTPDKLDFGPSLLDEINSMFGSMTATTGTTLTTTTTHNKNAEIDNSNTNTNTHNKRGDFSDLTSKLIRKNSAGATKKSKNSCGVVKPISVKDERILNQAIEIANEISARSMCSLVSDQPPPSTQSPKRKFSFRFPHLSNHPSSVEKAQTNIGLNTAGVGTASSTSHLHTLSPNSKKKNFTEELKSIPDLQCFRSMSSDLNNLTTSTSTVDIRIPLFDKKSSDFCFEKSREILSRPLTFGSQIIASDNTNSIPPSLEEYKDSFASVDRGEDSRKKTLNENLFDIENTLKALNLDFMHTYTDLDKTDSDETILNDQFSSIVSSIDDEISSAAGSLKSTGVFNYNNGKNTTTTTFDFNAATTHLDKHLQYMKNAQANNQNVGTVAEKCCSTPDTGFASRDTISLSRRSSQKSSYSPQDSYFSPSACNGIAGFPLPYKNGAQRYNSENVTSPFRGSQITPHENSTTSEIIGEEGREAYKSLIERKPLLNAAAAACLLGQLDPHIDRLNMTKTLPRRSMQRDEFCLSHGVNNFTTSPRFNGDIDRDLMIPPLQNAPRPTTLPTRGAANRARKAELGLLPSSQQRDSVDSSHSIVAAKTSDNISPCESPSYVTNTASFKLPDSTPADLNPLPVPPKEGKKHIQTNPKRHVRKYPLILPANGVQRTLNKVIGTENTNLCNMAVTVNMTPSLCIKKTSQIATPTSPSAAAAAAADYENFKNNERNYQNVEHSTADDSASLQFESILEADFNKDQVLHTPDVTDGFYNFSIQKEHYHKSKEVEYDPKKLTGLYVNEDELRNLDIDGNLEKLKVNAAEHIRKIEIQNGMKMKTPPKQEEQIVVEKLDEIKTQTATLNMPSPSSVKRTQKSEENVDEEFKSRISPPVGNANTKRLFYVKTAKNELAGHALFQKVRESADKAAAVQTSDNEAQRHSTQMLKTDITEGEFFTAAVNRLGASNSVSCEDLLEFADKKPKGRERGIDSDEVRIMVKVLGKDTTPERCLASLEFINWDVHKAIKILKLQNILNTLNLTLADTVDHLQSCDWDLHTTARRLKIMKT